MYRYFFTCFLIFSFSALAQDELTDNLKEILVFGRFSPNLQTGYSFDQIPDSLFQNQFGTLQDVLRDEANFYFKENGRGMVSSVSLRGSTASQTAVYWNGVPINSSLNGQTDFNTLGTNSASSIEIRKGGGSVLLGSGAIGGAINLKDEIQFDAEDEISISAGIGQFDTYAANLKVEQSFERLFLKLASGYNQSENDYPFPGLDEKNENGAFKNFDLHFTMGLKLDEKNELSLFQSYVMNDRNLSGTLTTSSMAKLKNINNRFLLNWKSISDRYSFSTNLAYLREDYLYYNDYRFDNHTENMGKNMIASTDFTYSLVRNIFFGAGFDGLLSNAEGDNLEEENLNKGEFYILFGQQIKSKFTYNVSFRKGFSNLYDIPFIYALDGRWKASENLSFRVNTGTNYRLPTFNDLFWNPGGNPDLKPEDSFTSEIGATWSKDRFSFDIAGFYIKSKNLIQWVPRDNAFWTPENIKESQQIGAEFQLKYNFNYRSFYVNFESQYTFVRAKDIDLNEDLIYVPRNKLNNLFSIRHRQFLLKYYLQFTDSVYITTSNTESLDDFWLSNLHFYYQVIQNRFTVGFQIENIFNQYYEAVAYRPMPGTNFNLNIKYQF